jgi:hypothetical protein
MDRMAFTVTAAVMLVVAAVGSRMMPEGPRPAQAAGVLSHAASSPEDLVDRVLEALEHNDVHALRELRVTEEEYREIVIPGNVPVGQAPKAARPEVADLAWKTLNTKSLYYERYLIGELGGRRYQRAGEISFEKGSKQYASFRTLRQLRAPLSLESTDGESAGKDEATLEMGSVLELAGQYKFISFIRD